MKLAEALLRRKELQLKVNVAANVKATAMVEVKMVRKQVSEGYDDITATVPKIMASDATAAFDWYSKRLRLIDAAIQQINWTAEMPTFSDDVMADYKSNGQTQIDGSK